MRSPDRHAAARALARDRRRRNGSPPDRSGSYGARRPRDLDLRVRGVV